MIKNIDFLLHIANYYRLEEGLAEPTAKDVIRVSTG